MTVDHADELPGIGAASSAVAFGEVDASVALAPLTAFEGAVTSVPSWTAADDADDADDDGIDAEARSASAARGRRRRRERHREEAV